jgi:hypothetical protein
MNSYAIFSPARLRMLVALLALVGAARGPAETISSVAPRSALVNVPLYFESAPADAPGGFEFIARGQARAVQLAPYRALVSLLHAPASESRTAPPGIVRGHSVSFDLLGANPGARLAGENELPGRINYFIGNDPQTWSRGLTTFERIRARAIYPGIDLVYYGNQERLEYDFILAPGAAPDRIRFRITGSDRLRVDANGDLVITLGDGEIRQHRPVAYQEIAGTRREVRAVYQLRGTLVSFELGPYDRTQPLVIDPILNLVTFFNGAGSDIAWDAAIQTDGTNGFLFVAGETLSANLPATPGAFTNQYAGGTTAVGGDAFVAKIDLNLPSSNLVYLTYLGGRSHDGAFSLAVDAAGNAFITGYTASTNFPIVGTLRTNLNAGIRTTPTFQNMDAFVTKLAASGSNLVYSAFLGGSGNEQGYGIAVDVAGAAYVTGFTDSTNFPSVNATYTNLLGSSDAFVTGISADGSSFVYSFPVGGVDTDRGEAIITAPAGIAYVCGFTRSKDFPVTTNNAYQSRLNQNTNFSTAADAFLLKVSPAGAIAYASYFGGNGDDIAFNLARDGADNIYLCGSTASTNFVLTVTNLAQLATTNAADAFVTRFDATLTNVIFSVAFGGTAKDEAWDLALDSVGRLVVVGNTFSTNLPATNTGNFLNSVAAGGNDAFVGRLKADGTAFDYLGYLGGSGDDLTYAVKLDAEDNIYFVGRNGSPNFPGAPALGGTADGFVMKIRDLPARLVVSPGSLVFTPVLTGAVTQASFVVTNPGSTTLTAMVSLPPDPFFLLGTNSSPVASRGFAVPAFRATNILVRFVAPTSSGAVTNEAVFVSNGGDSTNTVTGVSFGTPVIVQPGASDTEFFFSFATVSGVSYDVQFKNVINQAFWQTLQTVSGDGTLTSITNLMNITNLTATSTQRFFRLRAH